MPASDRRLRIALVGAVVLALVQVFGSIGAHHAQPETRPVDAGAVLLLLVAPATLALGRRGPRWLPVVLVGAATAAYLVLGYPFGPVVAGLALALVFTVATGRRLLAWTVAAGVVVATGGTRFLGAHGANWQGIGALFAWAVVVLAFGELVRGRRERAMEARHAAQERRRRQAGEERLRIAQELHDVVAHHLSLINVQAGVALHLAQRRPENVEPALVAIKDASHEALVELRSLVDVLRQSGPAPRAPAPTLAALGELVERIRAAGLDVTQTVEGHQRPLAAAVELAAYRIVQEAVTNVVRHAAASRALVTLDYQEELLEVRVDDDGRGSPWATGAAGPLTGVDGVDGVEPGNGLRGMQERAQALGGSLTMARSPLGGLRVAARLPLPEAR